MNEITMKETVNLIHGLKKLGLTDSQILDFIEFVESADPEILERLGKPGGDKSNDDNN